MWAYLREMFFGKPGVSVAPEPEPDPEPVILPFPDFANPHQHPPDGLLSLYESYDPCADDDEMPAIARLYQPDPVEDALYAAESKRRAPRMCGDGMGI